MKKQLLTVLLSVFMVMSTFTTRVFAEDIEYGTTIITDFDGLNIEIKDDIEDDDDCFAFEVMNTEPYKAELIFVKEDENFPNIKIPSLIQIDDKTITINNITKDAFISHGQIKSVTIPSSIENIAENAFEYCTSLQDIYVYWSDPKQITLGNELFLGSPKGNITLHVPYGCKDDYKDTAPWNELKEIVEFMTIADILPDDFPNNGDSAWVCNEGFAIYRSNNNLFFTYEDLTFPVDTILTKDGSNYKYSNTVVYPKYDLVFEMNSSGELQKIHVNNVGAFPDNNYTLEPLGNNMMTIMQVLNNYADEFPEESNTGWINESNANRTIYRDDDTICVEDKPSHNYDFYFSLYMPLVSYESGYKTNYDGYDIRFIIKNSKLKNIQILETPDDLTHIKGTYSAPVTIASLLDTVDDGFPNSKESGWVSDTKHLYLGNSSLFVNTDSVLAINLNPEKIQGTNDYKYDMVVGNTTITFTFKMDNNDKLEKIIITGDDGFNGEYVPYQFTNDPISVPVGHTGDLEFVTNAVYINDSDVTVRIDNNSLPLELNQDYTVSHNSTHVKLKGSYVSTLSVGTHTIAISVTGYSQISQQFTITDTPSPSPNPTSGYKIPKTGVE